jgi:hypothetical protein
VTNVRFVLYHLNYPLRNASIQLSDYIASSKSIVALDKSLTYRDHLCAFRCLAVHQGNLRDRLETHIKALPCSIDGCSSPPINTSMLLSTHRNTVVYHSMRWPTLRNVLRSTSMCFTYVTTTSH